jgi:hypothetical protein
MKTTRNALFALLLLAAGTVTTASAQVSLGADIHIGPSGRASVDLGFFYDSLASYGNWIQRPNYGWVWTPSDVSTSWRPYEDGHWVWTDQGWTWITDEPYGWATYHYGRWYQDPEIGWSWVPGDQWGPAWVSWQEADSYVGWAPLPPGVDISYDSGYGYNGGYNGGYASYDYGIGPEAYVFVPERNFLSLSIASYVVPEVQVRGFWGHAHNYTSYRREGDRIYNQGIPVDRIQQVVGRSVTRYQIADLQTTDYRQPRARISGNQVQIFRPQVQRTAQVAPPVSRPAARQAVVSAEQFRANHPNRATRGQQVYGDQQQTNRYQQRQQQGAQPGQVQTYQPRTYNGQVPQDQYQNGRRQRQVNPYNTQQDQYQQQQQQQQQQQRRYNQQRYRQQNQDQDQNNQAQRPPRTVNPQQQDRQRQYDNQQQDQSQNDRQRRYNDPQRYQQQQDQNQNNQRPPRVVNPQQDRQQAPPPRANRQQEPPPQSQGNHNGEARRQQQDQPQNNGNGNGNGNGRQNRNRDKEKDRDQNQDQDNHRPPVR